MASIDILDLIADGEFVRRAGNTLGGDGIDELAADVANNAAAQTVLDARYEPGGTLGNAPSDNPTFTGSVIVPAAADPAEALNLGLAESRYSPRTGLVLPGAATDYVSAPDSANWTPTTSLELTAILALNDWTPGADSVIVAQYLAAGNQRAWYFSVSATGNLTLVTSADGNAAVDAGVSVSSLIVPAANGERIAVRVVWTAGTSVMFYTAPADRDLDDDITWTQLGATDSTVLASIFNSTGSVIIGQYNSAVPLAGVIEQVRIIVDGVVRGAPDFTAPMAPRMRDAQGNLWTFTGSTYSWRRVLPFP